MSLESLIEKYADVNHITVSEAWERYETGLADKYDLLDAYLEWEGILGYSYRFRTLFELLEEL